MSTTRRELLVAGIGLGAAVLVRPAAATPEEMEAAVRAFTGGAPVRDGRVRFEIAPLVENGNTVPITVSVDSPARGRVDAHPPRDLAEAHRGGPAQRRQPLVAHGRRDRHARGLRRKLKMNAPKLTSFAPPQGGAQPVRERPSAG